MATVDVGIQIDLKTGVAFFGIETVRLAAGEKINAGLRANLALACVVGDDMPRAKAEVTRALTWLPTTRSRACSRR